MTTVTEFDRIESQGNQTLSLRVCHFTRGGMAFVLPADFVQEVLETEEISRLPRSAQQLVGLRNLRNRIIFFGNPDELQRSVEGEILKLHERSDMSKAAAYSPAFKPILRNSEKLVRAALNYS